MIRTRPALDSIAPYVPGRATSDAVQGAVDLARLASNESPFPPPQQVVDAICRAAAGAHRYPDDDVGELTDALSASLGVPGRALTVGNGSSELLARCALATLGPGDNVVFASPSFVMYPILAQLTGAQARPVPLRDGAFHDLDAMAAAVDARTRLVFVCTPNNPTGAATGRAELARFLHAVAPDCLVVLDEAYQEFVDVEDDPDVHHDGIPLVQDHPNVLVTRTFSKAYGLAALRCGYAVAHPDVIATIDKVRMPFVTNHLAQHAALAALQARDECLTRVASLVRERNRVGTALTGAGLRVAPSHGNFLWIVVPGRSRELAAACERDGVLVRPLGPDGVRVTIGAEGENDRLIAACTRWAAATLTVSPDLPAQE